MVIKWEFTVRGLMKSCSATCAFVSPPATKRNTSTSRAVKPSGKGGSDFTGCAGDSSDEADVKGINTDSTAARACTGDIEHPSAYAAAKAFSSSCVYPAFTTL